MFAGREMRTNAFKRARIDENYGERILEHMTMTTKLILLGTIDVPV